MPDLSKLAAEEQRRRFASGDVLAPIECIVACADHGRPVPHWARDALADSFRRYLAGEALSVALFGRRRGKHADPRKAKRAEHSALLKVGAVTLAEQRGERGDAKYDEAIKLLQHCGEAVGPERLKQLKRQRKVDPGKAAYGAALVGIIESARSSGRKQPR